MTSCCGLVDGGAGLLKGFVGGAGHGEGLEIWYSAQMGVVAGDGDHCGE